MSDSEEGSSEEEAEEEAEAGEAAAGNAEVESAVADSEVSGQEQPPATEFSRQESTSNLSESRASLADSSGSKEKKKKKPPVQLTPEGSIWVTVDNPKAPEKARHKKILLSKETTVADMRRICCQKVGCQFKEFQLEIGGKPMWVGREQPFKDETKTEAKMKWKKMKRLPKFIDYKETGGINGRSGRYNRTILHYLAMVGDNEMCEEVFASKEIDAYELVNVRDELGDTALTLAAITGFSDIVALLIAKQADLENCTLKGRNAMLLAAEHGHQDVVQILLFAGANYGPIPGTTRPDAMYLAHLNKRDAVMGTIKNYLDQQAGEDDDDWDL